MRSWQFREKEKKILTTLKLELRFSVGEDERIGERVWFW